MAGVALKCARNARKDVKEEEEEEKEKEEEEEEKVEEEEEEEEVEEGTMSDTAKVTEAAIMKGELITPARQHYY